MASACAGELLQGAANTLVRRVCTDSRHGQPGDLFFALKGSRFDGHDFLWEAIAKGAAAVVVNRDRVDPKALQGAAATASGHGQVSLGAAGCGVIAVEDTRLALGRLAAKYRLDFYPAMIAVGGSNGKTTVKELIASVLRQKQTTLWSQASYNNDIGVPLTLLRLEKEHRAAVLEVGTNHPGELAPLLGMIQPTYAVITNIQREHLAYFGDIGGVAEEEGWLAEMLPANGVLLINGDDVWADYLAGRTRARVVRVGFSERNDWRAFDIKIESRGTTFYVTGPNKEFWGRYRINLLGRHQVVNALFAIAVGEELKLGRPAVRDGLAECQPASMRLQLWEANGVWVLNDAYNANPDSVKAALETLMELPCSGRRVAVLGDMAELGDHTEAAHQEIGRHAAELGVGQLFAIGRMAGTMGRAARAAGLGRVIEFGDLDSAVCAVRQFLRPGDLVLIKASRAARLERLAEALRMPESKRAECCFT